MEGQHFGAVLFFWMNDDVSHIISENYAKI